MSIFGTRPIGNEIKPQSRIGDNVVESNKFLAMRIEQLIVAVEKLTDALKTKD